MRFATDENFDNDVLRGLLARLPSLDVIRVQDTELYQSSDPELLDWLGRENRILLTHDVRTMPNYVFERYMAGLPVPGVVVMDQNTPISQSLDELEILIGAGVPADFENEVRYIPIR